RQAPGLFCVAASPLKRLSQSLLPYRESHTKDAATQSAEAAFASFGAPEGFRTCTSQNAAAT
ncbi:MAG TPA: hypothetical protein VHS80_00350, partial [Chthoniobacterales bacterium]|nr:hypothetical protein [Chthoniobacterales bacterium]